jgi:subtilisin family serine protease
MKTKLTLAVAVAAILSGCGGGGSSSSSTPTTVEQTEEVVITPAPSACDYVFDQGLEEDNEFITSEYCNTPGLALIKASSAYLAGATGAGVKIAVVDSGINYNHIEFAGKTLERVSFFGYYYDNGFGIDLDIMLNSDQIESFLISDRGTGYTSAPQITIDGDGLGGVVTAKGAFLSNYAGVYAIGVENHYYGSGYTYATATIDNTDTNGSGLVIEKVLLAGDDVFGHGSFIAGVIAAKKDQINKNEESTSIQGVAYNAEIFTAKGIGNYSGDTGNTYNAFKYVVENNISIVNMSYGWYFPYQSFEVADLNKSINQGMALIMGAGNDGFATLPDADGKIDDGNTAMFPSSQPYLEPDLIDPSKPGAFVVVGAIDENKEMADFGGGYASNRAGVNKNYYLVALGKGLKSVGANKGETATTGYVISQGTSYATPFVVGAFALMKEKYPEFTARQIADIYFETAQDLGEPGTDDIFGRGLIDIKAAFELAAVRAAASL